MTDDAEVLDRKHPVFKPSNEALILYNELKQLEPGEEITYERLCKAIGESSIDECRGWLQTARRICQRDDNILFSAIRGYGLKRLTNDEIPELGANAVTRLGSMARREKRKMECVDFMALDEEKRSQFSASVSLLHMTAEATKPSRVKKLRQAVDKETERLSFRQTLHLFG